MGPIIEKKPYGPMTRPEIIKAIKDRVYFLEDDIIMWKEMPIASVFSVKKFGEKLRESVNDLNKFYMVIDLTETKRPTASVRSELKNLYSSFKNFKHAAVFTGSNFMLNIAAKFVLNFVGLQSYSVHKTLEEALKEIEKHKKKDLMAI